jgi:hypothetical protein
VATDAAAAESASFTAVLGDDVDWAEADAADANGITAATRAQTEKNGTAARMPSR